MEIILYKLSDPTDTANLPRYIGVTSVGTHKRLISHIWEAKTSSKISHKIHWIKKILSEDLVPVITIISSFNTWQEAFESEKYLIKEFKSKGIKLTNTREGGQGVEVTEDIREQRRLARLGKKASEATRQKLRDCKKGLIRRKSLKPRKPHIVSKETCEKMSKALKGKPISESRLFNLRKAAEKKRGKIIPHMNTSKKVIYKDLEFESAKVAYSYGISNNLISMTYGNFTRVLTGKRTNKTNFNYE